MEECVFCKIIKKELPAEIVFENDSLIVFPDINLQAPVHLLIVTKEHLSSLSSLTEDNKQLAGEILLLAKKLAKEHRIEASGYRLVTNSGPDSGQEVDHIHFHLLGGKRLGSIA